MIKVYYYLKILTPTNVLIVGITQEPSAKEYYLVLYHDVLARLDRIIQAHATFIQYKDFYEIGEIGSGGYGTVYTAKYRKYSKEIPELVALKRFKLGFKSFITEVSNLCIVSS